MDALSEPRVAPLSRSRAGIPELRVGAAAAFRKKAYFPAVTFRDIRENSRPERLLFLDLPIGVLSWNESAQPEMGKVVGFCESAESGNGRRKTETAVPLRPGETLVRNRMDPP